MKNSYLENLLNDSALDSTNMTLLFAPDKILINKLSGFPREAIEKQDFWRQLNSSDSFLYRYEGRNYVVSKQSLDSSASFLPAGFQIVNVTLMDNFRQRSSSFLYLLAKMCVAAIVIGLLIAFLASKRLYRPLKETVTKISSDFPSLPSENEYDIINNHISMLHQKSSSSQELLYHSLVRNLLAVPLDAQEIEKQLFSAGIDFPHPEFMVCCVEIAQPSLHGAAPITQTANEVKMLSDSSMTFHAALLEERQLGVLINGSLFPPGLPDRILCAIQDGTGLQGKIFYGSPFKYIEDTRRNYAMLLRMQRYEYFFPNRSLYNISDFRRKDLSPDHLPSRFSSSLATLLRSRKTGEITKLLDSLKSTLQEADYSYETCNSLIIKMIYLLAEYIAGVHLEKEFPLEEIYDALSSLPEIDTFTKEYLKITETAYQMLDSRNQNQNTAVLRQIQEYVLSHLEDNFSRLFRKSTKMTPSAFRNQASSSCQKKNAPKEAAPE